MSELTRVGDVETWWDAAGEGRPLVLLHPGGADSRAWDDNLPGLSESKGAFATTAAGRAAPPMWAGRSPSTR